MSNTKKSKFSILYVLYVIILLLVFVALLSFVSAYTNGFTDDFKTFYVKYDDYIFATKDKVSLARGYDYRFDIGSSLSFTKNGTNIPYTVSVVPNITDETNFEYVADDESYLYESNENEDFASVFEVEIYDDYFTLRTPRSMQSALSKLPKYSYSTLSVSNLDMSENAYFSVIVTTYNGNSAIEIDLYLYGITSLETPVLSVDKTSAMQNDVLTLTWSQDPYAQETYLYGTLDGETLPLPVSFGTSALIVLTDPGIYTFRVVSSALNVFGSVSVSSRSSNTVTVVVQESENDVSDEYEKLSAPVLTVEIDSTYSSGAIIRLTWTNIDSRADTIGIYHNLNDMPLATRYYDLNETNSCSLTVKYEGTYTFYAEVTDSTGQYLGSEKSEAVTITVTFS